jgi:NarL family two-component system response regulator YdfI
MRREEIRDEETCCGMERQAMPEESVEMNARQQKKLRLLIANDQHIVRAGLRTILADDTGIEIVDYATSIPETLRLVGEHQPDVVLMEPFMHGQNGLRAIELIRGEWPDVAIIVFTISQHNDEFMLRTLHAGVRAYLTSNCEHSTLLHAISIAAQGETLLQPAHMACLLSTHEVICVAASEDNTASDVLEKPVLTQRERAVLQRVARGERNKEIAARLVISEPTVKTHLANIFYKLGVDSRASAVAVAMKRGILVAQRDVLL